MIKTAFAIGVPYNISFHDNEYSPLEGDVIANELTHQLLSVFSEDLSLPISFRDGTTSGNFGVSFNGHVSIFRETSEDQRVYIFIQRATIFIQRATIEPLRLSFPSRLFSLIRPPSEENIDLVLILLLDILLNSILKGKKNIHHTDMRFCSLKYKDREITYRDDYRKPIIHYKDFESSHHQRDVVRDDFQNEAGYTLLSRGGELYKVLLNLDRLIGEYLRNEHDRGFSVFTAQSDRKYMKTLVTTFLEHQYRNLIEFIGGDVEEDDIEGLVHFIANDESNE